MMLVNLYHYEGSLEIKMKPLTFMCTSRTNCNQMTLQKIQHYLPSLRMLILFNVDSEQALQLIYSTFLSVQKCFVQCYSVVSFGNSFEYRKT